MNSTPKRRPAAMPAQSGPARSNKPIRRSQHHAKTSTQAIAERRPAWKTGWKPAFANFTVTWVNPQQADSRKTSVTARASSRSRATCGAGVGATDSAAPLASEGSVLFRIFRILHVIGVEAEEVPALPHMVGERRGHVERAAGGMRRAEAGRMEGAGGLGAGGPVPARG